MAGTSLLDWTGLAEAACEHQAVLRLIGSSSPGCGRHASCLATASGPLPYRGREYCFRKIGATVSRVTRTRRSLHAEP
jgi:hypothetical protein